MNTGFNLAVTFIGIAFCMVFILTGLGIVRNELRISDTTLGGMIVITGILIILAIISGIVGVWI
jgi:hypothetical protein